MVHVSSNTKIELLGSISREMSNIERLFCQSYFAHSFKSHIPVTFIYINFGLSMEGMLCNDKNRYLRKVLNVTRVIGQE